MFQAQQSAQDFNDRRVFVKLDPATVHQFNQFSPNGDAAEHLFYEQSAGGPTAVYMDREVGKAVLAKMADRHGLSLAGLLAFRDGAHDGDVFEAMQAA